MVKIFKKSYCTLDHWKTARKRRSRRKDQFTDLVYRPSERCISTTEGIKMRCCDGSLLNWLWWWRKFKKEIYVHRKKGEEGRSCTWHTLAFITVVLFFTSPQPSTYTVPCEQPAELLLSHCSSCFNFSKRGTGFYFLNTLMTRSAAEKQTIYVQHLWSFGIPFRSTLLYYCTAVSIFITCQSPFFH